MVFSFPSITHLFFSNGPSTVARFVISVVIYSIDSMLCCRFSSHVVEEVLIRERPSIAYVNTPTAVVTIVIFLRIEAPLLHRYPSFPFRSLMIFHYSKLPPAFIVSQYTLSPAGSYTIGFFLNFIFSHLQAWHRLRHSSRRQFPCRF